MNGGLCPCPPHAPGVTTGPSIRGPSPAPPRPSAPQRFEIADIVRQHGDEYALAHGLPPAHRKVLFHIASCRTPLLGGHTDECDHCGLVRISYNSCSDRHCPKCQTLRRGDWLAERLQRILPVRHFHVVLTVPHELNPIAICNPEIMYGRMFAAASSTLLDITRNPDHFGGQIGLTAVLHTWSQELMLHPHIHLIVTGGGLAVDGTRWLEGDEKSFLPRRLLREVFRDKLLGALGRAYRAGKLELAGEAAALADPDAWADLIDRLQQKTWVVYAKPALGDSSKVFEYLARYTQAVAISNYRIVGFADGQVTFTKKKRESLTTTGGRKRRKKKRMRITLDAVEFLRRFLLHVLPKRFVRIRHYGLSAPCNIQTKLATARRLLQAEAAEAADAPAGTGDPSSHDSADNAASPPPPGAPPATGAHEVGPPESPPEATPSAQASVCDWPRTNLPTLAALLAASRPAETATALLLPLSQAVDVAATHARVVEPEPQPLSWSERFLQQSGIDVMACPRCQGRFVRRAEVLPVCGPRTLADLFRSRTPITAANQVLRLARAQARAPPEAA